MTGWAGSFRQEDKRKKSIEDQVVGISAGAGGRNISEEFNMGKPCQMLLQLISEM